MSVLVVGERKTARRGGRIAKNIELGRRRDVARTVQRAPHHDDLADLGRWARAG